MVISRKAESSAAPKPPVTWLILGDKRGDNGQVETIVERLGWPCIHKYVHMRDEYVLGKPRFKPSLDHLDLSRSDPLQAPWPDIILTIGRRPSMVALWVRQQSGNRTRIVLVGKPTGGMEACDLVIASSENQLPPLDNLLPITLPLMRVDPAAVANEAARWQDRLAAFPRPLIAVFVGGETNPFRMNNAVLKRLVQEVERIQRDLKGTAYVVTSRRTKPEFVAGLQQQLPADTPLFVWSAGAEENPYRALLGAADGFVVTGDSISMMVEVIALGKPLAILPLPQGFWGSIDQLRRASARLLFNPRKETLLDRCRHPLARLIFRLDVFKLLSFTRDFRYFHRLLVAKGLAVWVGEAFKKPSQAQDDDLDKVVARIRALAKNR